MASSLCTLSMSHRVCNVVRNSPGMNTVLLVLWLAPRDSTSKRLQRHVIGDMDGRHFFLSVLLSSMASYVRSYQLYSHNDLDSGRQK